jgi:hypothetical protein
MTREARASGHTFLDRLTTASTTPGNRRAFHI